MTTWILFVYCKKWAISQEFYDYESCSAACDQVQKVHDNGYDSLNIYLTMFPKQKDDADGTAKADQVKP